MAELSNEELLKLTEEGKTPKEIGKEYGLSAQKVGVMLKVARHELSKKPTEDDVPMEAFAEEYKGVVNQDMGNSVIMTAREYHEYHEANGRYQGRKQGEKTTLDPMELRVAINSIGGDIAGRDVVQHLCNKHGITVDELKQVAARLTREEEISYVDVLKPLGLRP